MKELVTVSAITNMSDIQETVTPEKLLTRFFNFLDVSAQTGRAYRYGIRQFIGYLHETGVERPTRETVLVYKRVLLDKGLKPATIGLYLSSIRRFFSWCESEGLYENITKGIKSPKQQAGHKRDYLSGSQIHEMLNKTGSKRDYAMISLLSTCGLRTIEIVRANVEDIRVIGDTTVLYILGKGRTEKTEFVKLSSHVLKAIQEYLSERGNVKPNEPLFVSESRRNKGQRLTTRAISGICKQAMKKAGFDSPRLTAHSLRHSAITIAILSGQELSDVQAFARHTNISTTMIYNHAVNRLKSMCEISVENAIFGECA